MPWYNDTFGKSAAFDKADEGKLSRNQLMEQHNGLAMGMDGTWKDDSGKTFSQAEVDKMMNVADPSNSGSGQQAYWDYMLKTKQMDQDAKNAVEKSKQGPDLEFNPVNEQWVDAHGNPSEKGKPGSHQVISLRDEFKDKGPGAFLTSERSRLAQEQANNLDLTNRQAMQGQAQARAGLASRGGLKGQNTAMLARWSMRDAMNGQQGLNQQNAMQNSQLESKGNELQMGSDAANLKSLQQGATMVNQFNLQKYNKQKEVEAAQANADATRAASQGGGKVICNELYLQGYMSEAVIKADNEFGRSILLTSPETMFGYWIWARTIVGWMKASKIVTRIVAALALPWANHMAYLMGVNKKDDRLGRFLMNVGLPFCKFLGTVLVRKKEI